MGCSSFSFPLYFQAILCAILVKQRERSASNLDRNVICEMHCGVKADRHCRHIVCLCLHPANKTRLRTYLSLRFADTNAIPSINQTISIFNGITFLVMKKSAMSSHVLYHTVDILNRPQTSFRSFETNKHCQGNKK